MPDTPPDSFDHFPTRGGALGGDSPRRGMVGAKAKSDDAPASTLDGLQTGAGSGTASDLASAAGSLQDPTEEVVDLASRYEIQETLGRGGMGEVVKAVDRRLQRTVAIKRIRGDLTQHSQALARFLIEARAVAALNHFNIVQVYDYGRTVDGPFLVMEYVDGESLAERLKRGPMALEEAVSVTSQLCDALGVAHGKGIIHRDIKPANVLLTAGGVPKLSDYGLARQANAGSDRTMAGAVLGTLDFMPPEQRMNASSADARSDLWSLAATFYQMVTGKSPKVIRLDALPGGVGPFLTRALDEAPEKRFQSAADFQTDLQALLEIRQKSSHEITPEGSCPKCKTANGTTRKFCRTCGESLYDQCPSCQTTVGAWEQFCGNCGKNIAETWDVRIAALQASKQKIESFRGERRFPEAITLAGILAELTPPRLSAFQAWGEKTLAGLKLERADAESRRDALLKESEFELGKGHYEAALKLLGEIPTALRNDAVAKNLQTAQELTRLLAEIRQVVASKNYDGLLEKTSRVLDLMPFDRRVVSLHEKLLARVRKKQAVAEPKTAGTRTIPKPERPAPLPKPDGPAIEPKSIQGTHSHYWLWLAGITVMGVMAVIVIALRIIPPRPTADVPVAGKPADIPVTKLPSENSTPLEPGNNAGDEVTGKDVVELSKTSADPKPSTTSPQPPTSDPPVQSPSPVDTPKPSGDSFAGTKAGDEFLSNGPQIKFCWCPPGDFTMGSSKDELDRDDDEGPVAVSLSKGFWLGKFELTQGEWRQVTATTLAEQRDKASKAVKDEVDLKEFPLRGEGDTFPMYYVCYDEAVEFCAALTKQEQSAGRLPAGWVYDLPTEAQWEFACRAGTTTATAFGETLSSTQANFKSVAGGVKGAPKQSDAVGSYPSNGWGLCDMHGNVFEWCRDWYAKELPGGTDPEVILKGPYRVFRGGSWYSGDSDCRSANRFYYSPISRGYLVGFRVAIVQAGGSTKEIDVKPKDPGGTRSKRGRG